MTTPQLDADGNPIVTATEVEIQKTKEEQDSEMLAKLVQAKVDENLKGIKDKLDAAYASRDAALKDAETLKQEKRDAEKKKLEEANDYKALYELKITEQEEDKAKLKAERDSLEAKNTELSRDVSVRDALKEFTFRNSTASDMAHREVTSQLVRNDKGDWLHRTGISIKEFAAAYAKDEQNSFLLKAKSNSGGGSKEAEGVASGNDGKSLFKLTQAEVLKMAAEGKLPKRKT